MDTRHTDSSFSTSLRFIRVSDILDNNCRLDVAVVVDAAVAEPLVYATTQAADSHCSAAAAVVHL